MGNVAFSAGLLFEALAVFTRVGGATAQTVTWVNQGQRYDTGYSPAVATNIVGTALSQHLGSPSNAQLWYNPGTLIGSFVSGNYTGFPGYKIGGANTGIGVNNQSLAGDPFDYINGNFGGHFIAAYGYPAGVGIPKMQYLPGTLVKGSPVTWSSKGAVNFGVNNPNYCELGINSGGGNYTPSIAMSRVEPADLSSFANDEIVIVAFNGYRASPAGCCGTDPVDPSFTNCTFSTGSDMYYQYGKLIPQVISWFDSPKPLPTVGFNPSVAMWYWGIKQTFFDGPWMGILEVYKFEPGTSFASISGLLDLQTHAIQWDEPQEYDSNGSAFSPKVAVCSEGGSYGPNPGSYSIVEVHNGGDGSGWMHVGRISTNGYSVIWGPNSQYVPQNSIQGQPSVTCSGFNGIESHADGAGNITSSSFTIN
jgi:hypothetical protein